MLAAACSNTIVARFGVRRRASIQGACRQCLGDLDLQRCWIIPVYGSSRCYILLITISCLHAMVLWSYQCTWRVSNAFAIGYLTGHSNQPLRPTTILTIPGTELMQFASRERRKIVDWVPDPLDLSLVTTLNLQICPSPCSGICPMCSGLHGWQQTWSCAHD